MSPRRTGKLKLMMQIRFIIVPDLLSKAPRYVHALRITRRKRGKLISQVQAGRTECDARARYRSSTWPSDHPAGCVFPPDQSS